MLLSVPIVVKNLSSEAEIKRMLLICLYILSLSPLSFYRNSFPQKA